MRHLFWLVLVVGCSAHRNYRVGRRRRPWRGRPTRPPMLDTTSPDQAAPQKWCYKTKMGWNWPTVAGTLCAVLAYGCGGRAAHGTTGSESADASSPPATDLPPPSDGGLMTYCAGRRAACTFTSADLPDTPPDQRWGWLGGADRFDEGCSPSTCGEAIFEIDGAGCATAAADSIESEYSACMLRYVEQFSWPCAADQRVRFNRSCTVL